MGKPYKENIRSGLQIQSKSKFKLLYKVNFSIPFLSDVGNLGNPFVIIVSGVLLYRMEVGEGKCYWFVILVSGFSFYPMLEKWVVCYPGKTLQIPLPLSGCRRPR